MTEGKKGRIGILTGGGDIPGPQPGHPRRHAARPQRRVRGRRHPPRLGRPHRAAARRRRRQQRVGAAARPRSIVERYALRRRHVPALVAHAPERRAAQGRAGAPQGQVHRREERPHGRGHRQPGVPRHRLPGAGRRRRHAQLRRRARPPRLPRRRHPQDDGQRRPRHRLLHGLRHLREPHHRDGAPGHQLRRLARAHRRARGLRPLRRLHGAAADASPAPPTAA